MGPPGKQNRREYNPVHSLTHAPEGTLRVNSVALCIHLMTLRSERRAGFCCRLARRLARLGVKV